MRNQEYTHDCIECDAIFSPKTPASFCPDCTSESIRERCTCRQCNGEETACHFDCDTDSLCAGCHESKEASADNHFEFCKQQGIL